MIRAHVLPSGTLRLTAANDTRAWLAERQTSNNGTHDQDLTLLMDGLEAYWTNGRYEPFSAGDGNPFVGLSSAPCIAESMDVADDGTRTINGRFWAFTAYALESPIETLKRRGRVDFTLVS